MGHTWLETLSLCKKWGEVVGLVAGGADVPQVADATLRTAEDAFGYVNVNEDSGLNQAAWILVQFGVAAKKDDPVRYLRTKGIEIPKNTTLPGLIAAVSEAMDNHLDEHGGRSDLGEIAQRALVRAVTERMQSKVNRLFGTGSEDIKEALTEFRKDKEFGSLSRSFFSNVTNESMDYFLSKTLNSQLGQGQRFTTMNEKAQFDEALVSHCYAASKAVEEYAGDWYSKHMYQEKGDISRESIRKFLSYGMKKMKNALTAGGVQDAS